MSRSRGLRATRWVFLKQGVFLIAPTRRGPLARSVGGTPNGLFAHLSEGLGLYDPFDVSGAEAAENPGTIRVRYVDVEAMAPVVRPTGFSLHLRVAGRSDEIQLGFRSNDERRDLVTLARAIRDRADEAGGDVEPFEPGGGHDWSRRPTEDYSSRSGRSLTESSTAAAPSASYFARPSSPRSPPVRTPTP